MEEGLESRLDSPLVSAAHQVALGSDEFVKRIGAILTNRAADPDLPQLRRLQGGRSGRWQTLWLQSPPTSARAENDGGSAIGVMTSLVRPPRTRRVV